MLDFIRFILGVLQEAFGGITEDWLKKVGVPTVMLTLLYATWHLAVSPFGPIIFVNCLGVFAIGLLIANEIHRRQLQKKWERGELTPPQDPKREEALRSALHTIEELQTKLALIDDTRPHLETEAVIISRIPRQPTLPGPDEINPTLLQKGFGSFALLRITNRPVSTNREAVARDLYATLSYFDAQGQKIFPTFPGVWVLPTDIKDGYSIGAIVHCWPSLKPYASTHLGIALGYLYDEPFLYVALSGSSSQYLDWLDLDLFLGNKQFPLEVSVVLGCHGFQTEYKYRLTISHTDKRLVLTLISSPLEQRGQTTLA